MSYSGNRLSDSSDICAWQKSRENHTFIQCDMSTPRMPIVAVVTRGVPPKREDTTKGFFLEVKLVSYWG